MTPATNAVAADGRDRATLEALFAREDDRRSVARRAHLHRAGAPLQHAYLVTAGWFARFRTGPGGAEAVTGVYMPGDVIGIDALADGPWPDELTALMDGAVLRLPLSELHRALAGGGGPALQIARLLALDSALLREALFAVGTQSSIERLGTFMLQTFERLLAAGLVAPTGDRFALPLTQAQLGAVTGLTSVHVNRVLRQLRTAGLLEFHGGVARVLDLPGLRRAAQRRA